MASNVFTIFKSNFLKFVRLASPTAYPSDIELNEENTLYYDFTHVYNRKKNGFCLLNRGDSAFIQFRTDYVDFTVQLIDSDGTTVDIASLLSLILDIGDGRKQWQITLNTSSLQGYYYILITTNDPDKPSAYFRSEWFYVKENHDNALLLQWKDSDTNGIIWGNTYQSLRLVSKLLEYEAGSTKTVTTDSENNKRLLRGIASNVRTWQLVEQPSWIVERINLALTHETVIISGQQWQTEDKLETVLLDGTDQFICQVKLTQVNYNNTTTDETLTGDPPPVVSGSIAINNTDVLLINATDKLLKS